MQVELYEIPLAGAQQVTTGKLVFRNHRQEAVSLRRVLKVRCNDDQPSPRLRRD